jgi:p-hydroxybenzoate 3-monooxygenase
MKTQVCIVGAGPAGLLLAHLLDRVGIESIVLEKCSRAQILERVRAGLIDQNTMDVLEQAGFGDALAARAVIHKGFRLLFDGESHRLDVEELTGGRRVAIYPQQEVVKTLLEHRERRGLPLIFGVSNIEMSDLHGAPRLTFKHTGQPAAINAEFVIGCDGFHGICRQTIPAHLRRELGKEYAFSWLGILCEAPRVSEELVYAAHARGFALFSTRSDSVQRMYLQCDKEASADAWSDDQIWEELRVRSENGAGFELVRGQIMKKEVFRMRSFVCETMRFGKLFLAGDAAHIVPPSAAKGLNLAVSDVCILFKALDEYYRRAQSSLLDLYEAEVLRRFWRAEEFSSYSTGLYHRVAEGDDFELGQRWAALRYLVSSRAAATSFAENYAGIPDAIFKLDLAQASRGRARSLTE